MQCYKNSWATLLSLTGSDESKDTGYLYFIRFSDSEGYFVCMIIMKLCWNSLKLPACFLRQPNVVTCEMSSFSSSLALTGGGDTSRCELLSCFSVWKCFFHTFCFCWETKLGSCKEPSLFPNYHLIISHHTNTPGFTQMGDNVILRYLSINHDGLVTPLVLKQAAVPRSRHLKCT